MSQGNTPQQPAAASAPSKAQEAASNAFVRELQRQRSEALDQLANAVAANAGLAAEAEALKTELAATKKQPDSTEGAKK